MNPIYRWIRCFRRVCMRWALFASVWTGYMFFCFRSLNLFLLILQHARQNLLGFMFRHGHYQDACMLFFPPSAIPPPLQTSSVGSLSSSSSPQRTDPLATEYGTIESLCEFCVGYGGISALEEVATERIESAKHEDHAISQYIAGAITRICAFFETNRHFNYLYKFLVSTYLLSWFFAFNLFLGCFQRGTFYLSYTNSEFFFPVCCMALVFLFLIVHGLSFFCTI